MTALNASRRIQSTKRFATSNIFVDELLKKHTRWFFDEKEALKYRGSWKSVFQNDNPIDLEIGIGSGQHLAKYGQRNPNRNLIGLELQYKPLLQSIRQIRSQNISNAIVIRYHGNLLEDLFAENELSDVFMYFLDPWPKKKHHKNRLIQSDFLKTLSFIQKKEGNIYCKTDHPAYFEWIEHHVQNSNYKATFRTRDLFNSSPYKNNISTQFENLWSSKGLNIHFLSAKNLS